MKNMSWIRKNPADPMICDTEKNGIPMLEFPLLTAAGFIRHGFTTRLGGVSKGVCSSMNLSFTRGDDEQAVHENYRRVADAFEITPDRIICSDQTHTTNIRIVDESDAGKGVVRPKDYTDVDGLITNVPGLMLATFFADCVPLYFVDPVHKAIGLSHSGWKGTAAQMGKCTLEAMNRTYGTEPGDVIAAIGPSICMDCYEVSEDVICAFDRIFDENERKMIYYRKPNGKYQLDLWKANEIILLRNGIRRENLAVTDICTCCNPDLLFSHRASCGKRGNLAALLGIAIS